MAPKPSVRTLDQFWCKPTASNPARIQAGSIAQPTQPEHTFQPPLDTGDATDACAMHVGLSGLQVSRIPNL
jgi:hypothetical protein